MCHTSRTESGSYCTCIPRMFMHSVVRVLIYTTDHTLTHGQNTNMQLVTLQINKTLGVELKTHVHVHKQGQGHTLYTYIYAYIHVYCTCILKCTFTCILIVYRCTVHVLWFAERHQLGQLPCWHTQPTVYMYQAASHYINCISEIHVHVQSMCTYTCACAVYMYMYMYM